MREIGVGDVLIGLLVTAIVVALSAGIAAALFFVVLGTDMETAVNAIGVTILVVCLAGGLVLAKAYPNAGKDMNLFRFWMAILLVFVIAGSAAWFLYDVSADSIPWFVLQVVSKLAVIFFAVQWILYFQSRDAGIDGDGLSIKEQETAGLNLAFLRRG